MNPDTTWHDRYQNMRHPRIFRLSDWLFDCLGLKGIGLHRLDWLRRLQWWAGASQYQHDHITREDPR